MPGLRRSWGSVAHHRTHFWLLQPLCWPAGDGDRGHSLRGGVVRVSIGAAVTEVLQQQPTRLLLICNPNNPTGTRLLPDRIIELAITAPQTLVVVMDGQIHGARAVTKVSTQGVGALSSPGSGPLMLRANRCGSGPLHRQPQSPESKGAFVVGIDRGS